MKTFFVLSLSFVVLLLSVGNGFSADANQINMEKKWLANKYEAQKSHCKGATSKRKCLNEKENWYKKQISQIQSDHDLYFYTKSQKQNRQRKTVTDQYGNVYHLN